MAKKSKQHEEKEEAEKGAEEKKLFKQVPVLTALFIVLSCLFGILIGIVAVVSFYSPQTTQEPTQPGEAPVIGPGNASAGSACMVPISTDEIKEKVKYFIDESFLKSRGYELKINKVESYNDYLYFIDAEVSSDEGSMPAGSIYATKDGEKIIIGPLYDLNEPLKFEQPTPETEALTCEDINKSDSPVLEAYVVSYCPYGLQMLRIINEFPGELQAYVKIRYIGSVVDDKVMSMHGEREATENLRQICIREEQSDKYWAYIGCFIKSGDTNTCLEEAGIDKDSLNACMEDSERGIKYASEDFELADQYGVGGSPTLILNGTTVNEAGFASGLKKNMRSAELVKSILCCAFNTQPEACSTKLPEESAATGFSEQYGGTTGSGSC